MTHEGRGALVRLDRASYGYRSGRPGVEGVTLEVEPGERVVLMGPNGSGKTTLLRLLTGELRPCVGSVEVLGHPAASLSADMRRHMGVVAAETVHVDALPARANAVFFARAAGLSRDRAATAVDGLFEALDLSADAHAPPGEYSYGMRRKLLLVEALAHDPELLLLDEPTLGLDPPARTALLDLLFSRARGSTAVLAALNGPADALALASRVVFLHAGEVVADDTPDRLLRRLRKSTCIEVEVEGTAASHPDYPEGVAVSETSGKLLATSAFGPGVLPALCQAVLAAGWTIRAVRVKEPDLADVFVHLTGEAIVASADEPA